MNIRLGDLTEGRDNNLNLLRFAAACTVVVGHSFMLATGLPDPLERVSAISIGGAAVYVFFVLSGFLITGSLLARRSITDFALARVLRIYPALLVVVLLTVAWGGWLTTAPGYFTSRQTWEYLARNSVMVFDFTDALPGLFEANPWQTVNGSLWTLPWELRMYVLLGLLWLVTGVFRGRRVAAFHIAVLLAAAVTTRLMFRGNWLVPAFFHGAAFYVLRRHVPLTAPLFAGAAGAIVIGLWAWLPLALLAFPYASLYLAYVPAGPVRRFNAFGDLSYGTYIYSCPVQQSIIALAPGTSPFGLLGFALPAVLALAWCSWHLVEKHALKGKDSLMRLARGARRRNARLQGV